MKRKSASLGILGLDIVMAFLVSVIVISQITDALNIFVKIIIGLVIGIAFAFLIITPYVGTIFQLVISAFYAIFIYLLVPYKEWLGGNKWWIRGISIAIFVITFLLHRKKISDLSDFE